VWCRSTSPASTVSMLAAAPVTGSTPRLGHVPGTPAPGVLLHRAWSPSRVPLRGHHGSGTARSRMSYPAPPEQCSTTPYAAPRWPSRATPTDSPTSPSAAAPAARHGRTTEQIPPIHPHRPVRCGVMPTRTDPHASRHRCVSQGNETITTPQQPVNLVTILVGVSRPQEQVRPALLLRVTANSA
jgi:hypothetical protein